MIRRAGNWSALTVALVAFGWSSSALADNETAPAPSDPAPATAPAPSDPAAQPPTAPASSNAMPALSAAGTATPNDSLTALPPPRDVKGQIPNLAYAYTASGASKGTVGAMAYGLGLGASGQKGILGGGVSVWGAPIDRLTLVGDATRDVFGNFAPSATAIIRIAGKPGDGWVFGALTKFKIEGFGMGPKNEVESEIEGGLMLSYEKYGWHFDLNAIGGAGTGDDGEVDAEGRLRLSHDLGRMVRVGIDGQARYRLAGTFKLPGGRTWDYAGGPQILVGSKNFFGAVTAGPATMGVINADIGWTAIVSVGGTTL